MTTLARPGVTFIPAIDPDADTLTAALAYGAAGFYLAPTHSADIKNPGSRLGPRWNQSTSRDADVLTAWFAGSSDGIALHCGRSGLVVFDVDNPDNLPPELAAVLGSAPYQSTRADVSGRGHYFFRMPEGRLIGNSTGKLGAAWGQVRGLNGVVIVAPTPHPAEGGRYRWVRTGEIPVLPDHIAELLDDASPTVDSATDTAVTAFIGEHTESRDPDMLDILVAMYERRLADGDALHPRTVSVLTGAMKEARTGCYSPRSAIDAIKPIFLAHAAQGGSSGTVRVGAAADDEWEGILAWAVGQALAADPDQIRSRTEELRCTPSTFDDTDDDVKAHRLPDGERATDVGNANRFHRLTKGRVRYVHSWGKFVVYRDGRWIVDHGDAIVSHEAKQVSKALYRLAAKTASEDPNSGKAIFKFAAQTASAPRIAAMIKLARGIPDMLINHEDLDADPCILNCRNGTVDLRTGQLRDHDPADLCTMQAPVNYDPHATAPLWQRCLQRWQPDPDMLRYLQLRAGAGATGIPTETIDIDYGEGGNGKSKYHGAIQHVLGPYATVPDKSLIVAGRFEQHPTVVADLFRKRIAVASETSKAVALNDEQIKTLTGGDRLKGRRMREDPWEFQPTHTLVMFSNHRPKVQGRDEGIWRRLRLVPWNAAIPEFERDENLAAKLQTEAAGILRWVVEGARMFLQDGKLTPPNAVRLATSDYRSSEDVIGRFVDEMVEFDDKCHCTTREVMAALDRWCAATGVEPVPRMNEVAATLVRRGASNLGRMRVDGRRDMWWCGFRLRALDDAEC